MIIVVAVPWTLLIASVGGVSLLGPLRIRLQYLSPICFSTFNFTEVQIMQWFSLAMDRIKAQTTGLLRTRKQQTLRLLLPVTSMTKPRRISTLWTTHVFRMLLAKDDHNLFSEEDRSHHIFILLCLFH